MLQKSMGQIIKSPKYRVAFLALAWITVGVFSRWIPHPPNFTAIGAVAVLGGLAYTSRVFSLLVPVLALFVSDLVLGFHSSMVWVYGAMMTVSLLSPMVLRRVTPARLGGMSLLATGIFFVITNFGVWAGGALYPMTAAGLMQSYISAIPFSLNQVLGDLLFVPLGVLSYQWALSKFDESRSSSFLKA